MIRDIIFILHDLEKILVPPGLEPGTFRVLSERDNHYTMELQRHQFPCIRVNQRFNLDMTHWCGNSNVIDLFSKVSCSYSKCQTPQANCLYGFTVIYPFSPPLPSVVGS